MFQKERSAILSYAKNLPAELPGNGLAKGIICQLVFGLKKKNNNNLCQSLHADGVFMRHG